MSVRPGDRYRSQVCDTEIVVVKGSDGDVDLRCGGSPLAPLDTPRPEGGTPSAELAGGTLVGKRYVDADGALEVLVTKSGRGTLSIGDTPIEVAAPRQLPTSD